MDSSGTVRLKRKLRNFDALLVLALTEIIRYGADAPQVVRRLHAMLDELQSTLPAERQAAIVGQRSLLEAAVSAALPAPLASVASVADREGLGLNHHAAHSYLGDVAALEPVARAELSRRLCDGQVLVLDVRPEAEYAAGHIPGAVNMPHDQLAARLAEIPAGADIVAYT